VVVGIKTWRSECDMKISPRKIVGLVWLVFFLGLTIGFVVWVSILVKRIAKKPAEVPGVYGQVSDFEFLDQDKRKIALKDLRGRIWVADFIFTRCAGPCPLMSSQMAKLQSGLQRGDGVTLVSFSVDPKYDTTEVLKQYAKRYGAQPGRWIFLTGDESRIFKMMREDFKMGVEEAGADAIENPIMHDTHFVLVDGDGKIRGYYGANGKDPVPKILSDILTLRQASLR